MRGGLRGRHIVVLVVALGLVVEIPLLVYILDRNDRPPEVATTEGTLGGGSSLPLHPIASKFVPDETQLPDCTDEQKCFEQAYGNVAYHQGAKVAFGYLKQQYGVGADSRCHRITHVIGAATLTRNKGNVARTFAEGSSACWSGFYHGVLERAFLNVRTYDAQSLGAKARTLCSKGAVADSEWLNYQCLHGLGHGLMITTGYQLPLTLDVCNELATRFEQTSCKGGVFMENIITSYGGKSPWLRDDDALYPCDWVKPADKFPCYQNAVTRIIRVVGSDWEKIAATCAEAEKPYIPTCFGSFGQTVSISAFRKAGPIIATCALARPYAGEEQCIRYAAMDTTGTYSSGKRAAPLCNASPLAIRGACYEAIGLMLRRLRPSRAAQRAECRAIASAPRYAARCIKGLTLKVAIPGLARS